MNKELILDGQSLKIADIERFLRDRETTLKIDPAARERVCASAKFLQTEAGRQVIYGVNTGFGPMADRMIGPEYILDLQKNLIRSHVAGAGRPVDNDFVLAAMLVRLNTLLKGYSGVSIGLIDLLLNLISNRVTPLVPEHGSVGASGDLVQLAHIALTLMGEGRVLYRGSILPAPKVFASLGLRPREFGAKEALAIINGTSFMSGVAALQIGRAERLIDIETRLGAMSLEIIGGFKDCVAEALHYARPHPGQIKIAASLRKLLEGASRLRDRQALELAASGVEKAEEAVQDVYSFRCLPQILGPILETVNAARQTLEVEINSATDNPLTDIAGSNLLHGGNFHGDYVAHQMDNLKAAIAKLGLLSERRINYFLHHKVNQRWPAFLNLLTPGLNLGLQGLQFVATSTAANSQTLAFPMAVHTIPTNGDNQDIVSMGTDAALFAGKIIDNSLIVLAVELITMTQAVDVLQAAEQLSDPARKMYLQFRRIFPAITEDRVLTPDLERVIRFLEEYPALKLSATQ